jgi:very-short-patch-repair endonuclease
LRYWHANPRFYGKNLKKVNTIQQTKIDLDKVKHEFAASKGYEVVVVWEYDLYNNTQKVLEEINSAIKIYSSRN